MSTRPRPQTSKIAVTAVRSRQKGDQEFRKELPHLRPLFTSLANVSETTEETVRTLKGVLANAPPAEAKKLAMNAINATSAAIGEVHKSGWKATTPTKSYKVDNIKNTLHVLEAALAILRSSSLSPSTERAALNVVGRLIALEMDDAAIQLIPGIRRAIIQLYQPLEKLKGGDTAILLQLPLPSADASIDSETCIVASTCLSYALQAYLRLKTDSLEWQEDISTLVDGIMAEKKGFLLSWLRLGLTSETAKHLQPLCTSLLKVAELKGSQIQLRHSVVIRLFALRCILSVSSADEVPWAWKQARNVTRSYSQSLLVDNSTDLKFVHSGLVACVEVVKSRSVLSKLLTDPSFETLRQVWSQLAGNAKDADALRYLESLSSKKSHPTSSRIPRKQTESLTSMTTRVEQSVASGNTEHTTEQLLNICQNLKEQKESLINEDHSQDIMQLFKTTERLRRHLRAISGAEVMRGLVKELSSLLVAIAEIYALVLKVSEVAVTPPATKLYEGKKMESESCIDIVSAGVENWIVISKLRLAVHEAQSYKPAFQDLSNACSLVDGYDDKISLDRIAELRRCMSGAFWNLGSSIHQAGRWDHSIPFISKGVEIDQALVDSHWNLSRTRNDVWDTFYQQLPKRALLLAGCFVKLGDRKRAYNIYLAALRCSLITRDNGFIICCTECPGPTVFEKAEYQLMADAIERITYLGITGLLLGKEASLHPLCVSLRLPPVATGAILERQIMSLEQTFWKPETRTFVLSLLGSVSAAYTTVYPIRLARLTVTHLEVLYFTQARWEEAKSLGEAAIMLISDEDPHLDVALISYRRQYLTSLHLWLAIHANSQNYDAPFYLHANEAQEVLISSVTSLKPDPSRKKSDNISVSKGKSSKSRTTTASKQKALPVTKRGNIKPNPITAEASHLTHSDDCPFSLENPERFWTLLEMSWNLYGALGLTHLKISSLSACARILRTKTSSLERDVFARVLIDLGFECAALGKMHLATNLFTESLEVINRSALSDLTKLLFLLRFAHSLAVAGNGDKSLELYEEARELASNIEWDSKGSSPFERTQSRIQHLIYTALACSTSASIQMEREDPPAALRAWMQALRIWNAAIDTLHRLNPKRASTPIERNPFDMEELSSTLPALQAEHVGNKQDDARALDTKPGPKGWHWLLSRGLFDVQVSLSQYSVYKGDPRGSEYFIRQARSLADALHASVAISKAVCLHIRLLILWKQPIKCPDLFATAEQLTDQIQSPQITEILGQKAQYYESTGNLVKAMKCLITAGKLLNQYDGVINSTLNSLQWLSSSRAEATENEPIMPSLLSTIILHQIWLLRDEEHAQLMEEVDRIGNTATIKSQVQFLTARLASHFAHTHLGSQNSLSSMIDSVMAIPMGVQDFVESAVKARFNILQILETAETEGWSAFSILCSRGLIFHVRECALMLVSSLVLQTSLGHTNSKDSHVVCSLLDTSSSFSLHRELLQCIEDKFQSTQETSDMDWPTDSQITASASAVSRGPKRRELLSLFQETESQNEEEEATHRYWHETKARYRTQLLYPESVPPLVEKLPRNWCIVTMCVSEAKDHLMIARMQPGQQSLLLCVPLKRAGRTDGEEISGGLSFESARMEMEDIVHSGSENGKRATQIANQSKSIRSEWWAERSALDERLKILLENIEFCWLGAFKTLLGPPCKLNDHALEAIHGKLYSIFKKLARKGDKRDALPSRLHPAIINCVAGLSPKCKDEEIEDLIYFILDQYQLSGHLVFLADIDIDEVVLEMRVVLVDVKKLAQHDAERTDEDDDHLFLVLDRNLQGFPLESTPILRGRSVSRIPSVSFLIDRLELARISANHPPLPEGAAYKMGGMPVDPSRVFYLLNPEGDLKHTEEAFSPWLQSMKKVGWNGIIGRRPTEFELTGALDRHDLFIYFGHGGAEQYIRGSKIRSLLRCSSTMLLGCSSGAMAEAGDFDRSGTPYNYLLAGCPLLVANMWDVTDRDIDKFSQSVFNRLRLDPANVKAKKQGKGGKGVSVVRAVAESREICKLKYLNGAAPVVYGIPFYL